jgi:hypothetical protein
MNPAPSLYSILFLIRWCGIKRDYMRVIEINIEALNKGEGAG